MIAATPLLFATLGELITEKSGSLNLGVEGMMLLGAVVGFMVGYQTGNPALAVAGAFVAGAAGAAIYAVLTVSLRANQVVTGLTLTIFGSGVAKFWGNDIIGFSVPTSIQSAFKPIAIPLLSQIPGVGPVLFKQDPFVYLGYLCTLLVALYLWNTRTGLNMRAVGENTAAADAAGIAVTRYKYLHIITGGGLCGLGGAYLSLIYVPMWQVDVVNGRGWIAVALVIFASWNPLKTFAGAYLFGALSILGLRLQAAGLHVNQYLVDMFPYLACIIIVVMSSLKNKRENQPPGNLSVPYYREDR
jgi:simple sugar transport system permease protein